MSKMPSSTSPKTIKAEKNFNDFKECHIMTKECKYEKEWKRVKNCKKIDEINEKLTFVIRPFNFIFGFSKIRPFSYSALSRRKFGFSVILSFGIRPFVFRPFLPKPFSYIHFFSYSVLD